MGVDPTELNKLIKRVVARELYCHTLKTNPNYTIWDARREIGKDVMAFLHARIGDRLDPILTEEYIEITWVKPARIYLESRKSH
jgi:hypothetical protein